MGGRRWTKGNRGADPHPLPLKERKLLLWLEGSTTKGVFSLKKITVQQLCIFAVMIALHIVLESLSIRIGNDYKITFSGLPIIIIAILYGPFAGFVVGLIGSVLSQILTFGITATTIYWIWPPAIHGLAVGLLFMAFGRKFRFGFGNPSAGGEEKKTGKKGLSLIVNPVTICIFAGGLVNTICNYIATYFDSKVWNYYSEIYMIGLIPIRLVNWVLTAVVSSIIVMIVIAALRKRFPELLKRSMKKSA